MNVSTALRILKDEGFKYTEKREDLVTLFAKEKRYLSARDVLIHMQKSYPGMSVDTIYRNLTLFKDLEILEETEWNGEKRYRLSCSTNHHHHHLICLQCGRTRQIESCPMEDMPVGDSEFKVTGHKFEVYGECGECQAQ
ncbi:Fur family transcriptional regulator [Alkalihalobacillus macyae]|uniref:Fur family transcriptional regulator n=1 Tax=Guptibacillus hwajinpoensis TaxID=208199 RepID=UPI00273B05F4|nr:Fur family transcriptional regulator [Alkalihalobacillus macyae]MDP4550293.1 Fur family transcriptional regulator [Alkalihalobacillus macyae]